MNNSQVSMPVSLPQTDTVAKKQKDFQCAFCEQINRLMTYFNQNAVALHKGTGIEDSTLSDWITGKWTPRIDDGVKKLARFWSITIDYLCFGTPMTDRDFELEMAIQAYEEKQSISA